jgi:hypothetical protein
VFKNSKLNIQPGVRLDRNASSVASPIRRSFASLIAIQDRHCVYKGGLVHVGIAGGHTDGLMAGSFLDDLEAHAGLSQPRAERFTEVVPAEILDPRFLKSRLPTLFVIPDSEDHILGSTVRSIYSAALVLERWLPQLGECVNNVVDHSHRSARLVLRIAKDDELLAEVDISPAQSTLLTLAQPVYQGNIDLFSLSR